MLEVNFSPFPIIHTSRLTLRCVLNLDAAALFEMRSMHETMQYIDRKRMEKTEEAEKLIAEILESLGKNEGIMWVITKKDNPELLIGSIGYWRIMNKHYRAELGYMLHPVHWRKGIMTEAIEAVIKYGFEEMKLHSIEAHINPANLASAAVLEKTGFVREAYFKEDYFYEGKFLDTAVYSLLAL